MGKLKQKNHREKIFSYAYMWLLLTFPAFAAEYVGSEQCTACHQNQYQEWQKSQHSQAMSHAREETVLGDFNNVDVKFAGHSNTFFRKGDDFWVNIEGEGGKFNDYQIKYTFGVYPLQQYMVQFDDGRIQLIPFSWDARPLEEGGQRWFHIYPQFTKNTDEFFWLNQGQNWNYMCADCHSTNIQKNYNKASNTYATTWSEINVACEACHGPASLHMAWTKEQNENVANLGFDRYLKQAVNEWEYRKGKSTLQPREKVETDLVRSCAQCHSRRTQLLESDSHIKRDFLDRHLLSLVNSDLYHKDGQIYDENFVYGSFLQSKMHESGVVCTDCHNPHSAQITMPEPALCTQCHIASEYTAQKHSHHPAGLETDRCSSCHMVEERYMQVDLRKDHSWQVPRPDLSIQAGVPNACINCHEDRTNKWALQFVTKWFPTSAFIDKPHFAHAFDQADKGIRGSERKLLEIVSDTKESAIIRASALERMQKTPGRESVLAIQESINNKNALIRLGAVFAAKPLPDSYKWQLLNPLLDDNVLAVRAEAAAELMYLWPDLPPQYRQQLQPALDEYESIQIYLSDRGHGRTNLGGLYMALGNFVQAEQEFLGAIEIEPIYPVAYINLADLYRQQGKQQQSVATLVKGSEVLNENADLAFAAGLAYVRTKELDKAIGMLEKATQLQPEQAHYFYVLAMAYERMDTGKAVSAFNRAYQLSNDPQHLYALCNLLVGQKSFQAYQCLNQLEKVMPAESIISLKQALNQKERRKLN